MCGPGSPKGGAAGWWAGLAGGGMAEFPPSDKSTAENLKRCEHQEETKPEGSDA